MDKRKIKVGGVEVSYDADAFKRYDVLRDITLANDDASGMFRAMRAIFCGKDAEYVDALGGSMESATSLFTAAVEDAQKGADRDLKNGSASSPRSEGTETK